MAIIGDIMTRQVITASPDETLFQVLGKMNKAHIKELPVVNENNRILGLVSYYDILDIRTPQSNLKVENIMSQVTMLKEGDDVSRALDMVIKMGVEAMAVVDKYEKLIGIVSEYDLLKHYTTEGLFKDKDIVDFVKSVTPLSTEDSILKAKRKMEFYRVPLLPVIDAEGKFVGIIDSYDLFFDRFTKANEKMNAGELSGELLRLMSDKIADAASVLKSIDAININESLDSAVNKMLKLQVKAIPVTNLDNEVSGILLRKDALTALSDLLKAKGITINFSGIKIDEITSEGLNEIAAANVRRLSLFVHNVESIEVHIKPVHYIIRKRYEIKMRLEHAGRDISVKEEGEDLFYTFEKAFKKLITVVKKEYGRGA